MMTNDIVETAAKTTEPPGPIFVGGAGRSGTTLLRVMLDSHPRICCGPELKVLPAIAECYQTLSGTYASVMESYGNSPDDLQRRFRDFINGLAANFQRKNGKPRWAEKTPHNILFMIPLGEIFPDARFIHVVRDGRDVACSLVTMDWMNPLTGRKWDYVRSIASAARYWREVVTSARRHAEHPTVAGRVLEVRYENLVFETEATLRGIFGFIGEPWDAAVLSHHTRDRSDEPIEASTKQSLQAVNSSSIGRWKTEMTKLDRNVFKSEAGDLLKALDYAREDW